MPGRVECGVSIVYDSPNIPLAAEKAFGYGGGILVEEFIKGREVEVGILDDVALGAIEIVPKVEFYSYEAKYTDGLAEHLFPAPLPPREYKRALDLGHQAHRLLAVKGRRGWTSFTGSPENSLSWRSTAFPG